MKLEFSLLCSLFFFVDSRERTNHLMALPHEPRVVVQRFRSTCSWTSNNNGNQFYNNVRDSEEKMTDHLGWNPIMHAASPVLDQRNYDRADGFLSREMQGLDANNRNAIHEEIHGVRCMTPVETPKLLEESLEAFWSAVRAIPESSKVAYNHCRRIASLRNGNPKHYAIEDPTFHLRFLRSELFDAEKAATRYINYLNFVHTHWGDIALEREIRFSDFSKEEIKLFRKGLYQLLPVRDKAGRKVLGGLRKMTYETEFDVITKVSSVQCWNLRARHRFRYYDS